MKLTIYLKQYERVGYAQEDIKLNEYKEAEILYNDQQQLLEETHFSSDNQLVSKITNQYDAQNRLISTSMYDEENLLIRRTIYAYNDEGDLCKKEEFYGEDNEMAYTSEFVYNEHKILLQKACDGDDSYIEKSYRYEGDNLIEQIDYDDFGEKQYIHQYTYNDAGEVTSYIRNEVQAKDRRTFLYEYNNGKKIKELVYNYSDTLIAAKYWSYSDQGLLLEIEEEDLDSYQKLVYHYEEERVIAVEKLDKSGKTIEKTEFFIDDKGQDSKAINYALDEVNPSELRLVSEIIYERS